MNDQYKSFWLTYWKTVQLRIITETIRGPDSVFPIQQYISNTFLSFHAQEVDYLLVIKLYFFSPILSCLRVYHFYYRPAAGVRVEKHTYNLVSVLYK